MRTTFFTSANRAYEPFVLPYISSVLIHNDDARVEVCLEDTARFEDENSAGIRILRTHFGDRFLLRPGRFDVTPNSVRFLETPRVATEFTYIGDIDILVLEAVTDIHLEHMRQTGLPYSNIIRPGTKRLSGLHFTRSDAYYPVQVPDTDLSRDEALLYRMVEARGLPDPADKFRPEHGIHMSPQRSPRSPSPSWGLTEERLSGYLPLRGAPVWQELVPHFSHRYRMLLMALDVAFDCLYPKAGVTPTPCCSIHDLFLEGPLPQMRSTLRSPG